MTMPSRVKSERRGFARNVASAIVTVSTTYAGADSDIIAGFITTPLENAIAQANGIDYMTSTSQSGVSTITVYLRLKQIYYGLTYVFRSLARMLDRPV